MSDNSCEEEDGAYLRDILLDGGNGKLDGLKLCLPPVLDVGALEGQFAEEAKVRRRKPLPSVRRSGFSEHGWQHFRNRRHGRKVPVEYLEPFIARYIKAIGACGAVTWMCCDGNHQDSFRRQRMVINFAGAAGKIWHAALVEICLRSGYVLPWKPQHTGIFLTDDTRYNIYYTLNRAAAFLYENRKEMRDIKQKAFAGMTTSYFRHQPPQEIAAIFEERSRAMLGEVSWHSVW